jgi:outer membrane protein OmpA-like peptidoglycan-associated protein
LIFNSVPVLLTAGQRRVMVGAMQEQTHPTQSSAAKSWSFGRVLLALFGGFAVLIVATAAIGFLAVRKASSIYHETKARVMGCEPSLNAAQKTAPPPAKPMALTEPCATLTRDQSAALRRQEASALVPLVPDMVLDTVWVLYDADLETLTRVSSVADDEIKFTLSGPQARAENGKAIVGSSKVIPVYPQCQADLASSHLLVTEGNPELSVPLPGATRISVSQQVYQELKSGSSFPFDYRHQYYPVGTGYSWLFDDRGEMQRDIPGPYKFKVILNGQPTELPALHARGLLKGMPTEIAVVDDPANPLLLDLEIPNLRFALRTTKITYPVAKKIESDLEQGGRAEIYGIYFDFDSAVIRAESEPVLEEIAEALRKNPSWQLSIQGHTDNIGGDAHNQALSANRAESVKKALIERYAIAPDRLTTAGFGATQPKAPNDTMEGRALNRRVELVKQG